MDIAPTAGRVEYSTPDHVNHAIARATECSVIQHALEPERIDQRLAQLDEEWDIERTLEAQAAGAILTGLVLSILRRRRWLGLAAFSGYFLLQHALTGWCPPVALYRRLKIRTAGEIERERTALKALRGDFGGIGETRDPLAKARAVLHAADGAGLGARCNPRSAAAGVGGSFGGSPEPATLAVDPGRLSGEGTRLRRGRKSSGEPRTGDSRSADARPAPHGDETPGGEARGGEARGGEARGGDARGGDARGGDARGGSGYVDGV
jgi:hypothetical protein